MLGMISDIGNVRNINEDFIGYYMDEKKKIFIIADGMGGHNAGEVASKLAVENIISFINNKGIIENPEKILEAAILDSNKKVYTQSISADVLKGMGTTITAVLIFDDCAYVSHVGDSSCHIIKRDRIEKLTKDHSLVQELIDEGSITEEEGRKHPNKNIITRAVGTNFNVAVDNFKVELEGVEKFVLCTDGLTNEVKAEEILNYTKNHDNQSACKLMIELAKERGGRDNISVMIFEGGH